MLSSFHRRASAIAAVLIVVGAGASVGGQLPRPQDAGSAPPGTKPAAIEKVGATAYRIGGMLVDTAKRDVRVPGFFNSVPTLEFVANTKGGYKAYESAMTLETNAVNFNAAMLLIGLDPAHAKPAAFQFDPTPPQGDPVEIHVEWQSRGRTRRVLVEELLYDSRTKKTLKEGPWIYTGSSFIDDGGNGRQYLAEMDGVLIGFMHGPQAIIDNPRNDAVGGFGSIILNPALGVAENTPLTLTVKALPLDKPK